MKQRSPAKAMIARLSNFLRPFPHLHGLIKARYYQVLRIRWQRSQMQLMLYLARAAEDEPQPFFVKVGANDGVTGDPIGDILIKDRRWHGLLIEPVDYCYQKLRLNYADAKRFTLMPVAVGHGPSVASFYYVDEAAKREYPDLPSWYDQLGSFSRQHILNHLDGILEPWIRERNINVVSLSDILRLQDINSITLLHVDTEGADLDVLLSLDFNKVRPRAILIEHKHLPWGRKQQLQKVLREQRYQLCDLGADYFAY